MDLRLDRVVIPGNEDHKTLETFAHLLDELKRVDPLRRSEPVLAVGGGVLTDTVGFACACWRRYALQGSNPRLADPRLADPNLLLTRVSLALGSGVPWCRMPTTLLGQVDASVGIKVAINYHRKNGAAACPTQPLTVNAPSGPLAVSAPSAPLAVSARVRPWQ